MGGGISRLLESVAFEIEDSFTLGRMEDVKTAKSASLTIFPEEGVFNEKRWDST